MDYYLHKLKTFKDTYLHSIKEILYCNCEYLANI